MTNLLTGPVLATREGCRRRVERLSLGQRWALARHFGLAIDTLDPEGLARHLHQLNHRRRRSRKS